jgi:outer membrane receptor protein involved in Fe transport
MKISLQVRRAVAMVLAGTLGPVSVAFAQTEAATQDAAAESATGEVLLEEVVVSAQKRMERLQDVPISAQVVSAQTLANQNLNSLENLSTTVPSVHVQGTIGRSGSLVMRGVGSGNNQAFDQSVGMFIDDIYHGRARISSSTFFDLERVEILKGPQSTFFGNNAIAGAFNVISRKPGNSLDGQARALYGEDGQYAVEGAANIPLTDFLSMRAAATFNGQDGYLTNVTDGQKVPQENNKGGRVTFKYSATDTFDATLKVEAGRNRQKGGIFKQLTDCPPPAPFTASGFCPPALAAGTPIGLDTDQTAENPGQRIDLDTMEDVLTMNMQLAGHTLTSVTGYYDYDSLLNLDADGTSLSLIGVQVPETYHQFSQELRLASPTGQTFEYLGGLYFQKGRLLSPVTQTLFFLTPAISGAIPALAPFLPLAQEIDYTQNEKTYSAFGAFTWNITDSLKLNTGLRGSWVEKDYTWMLFYGTGTQDYGGVTPLPPALAAVPGALNLGRPDSLAGDRSDDALMPSANVQYKLTPDAMVYASYSRGFKAGGFNAADNNVSGLAATTIPYDPEYVDAYELGIKSEFFKRLIVNAAVFHSEYKDLQVTTNFQSTAGSFISIVRNAATFRSQGVELEAQWAATDALRFSGNVAYNDATYVDYQNVSLTPLQSFCRTRLTTNSGCADRFPNGIGQFQDLSGTAPPFAPKWSGGLTGAYTVALPRDLRFTGELSSYVSSDYYQNVFDEFTGAYVRLDTRLSLETADGRWALDVIGKNLTDKQIYVFGGGQANSPGSNIYQFEHPRNFAMQVRYHW